MANPLNPAFRRPNNIPHGKADDSVRSAIQSHDNSITDLNQAVASLKGQINELTPSSSSAAGTSTNTTTSTENITNVTIAGGPVNNQTGVVAYTTAQGDNGALLIFADAAPVAVTLNNAVTLPWYCVITNQSTGLVTLTPQQGTVNGNASATVLEGYFISVYFDGANFWAASLPLVPVNTPAILHEWLKSYDSSTGEFTQTRPDYSDLTGLPQLPITIAAAAHKFLTSYTSSTGLFTNGQPAFTDVSGIATTTQIGTGTPSAGQYVDGGTGVWTALPTVPAGLSVTIVTAALTGGGTQGSMTFTGGLLTASTPAT